MNLLRRPRTLFAIAAVASVATGTLLGVATHSDAAPAAATVTVPKVPNAKVSGSVAFLRPGGVMRSGTATATMSSGGLAAGPNQVMATQSPYRLVLENNGNLVEYRDGYGPAVVVWQTGTRSSTPTSLTFQSDGNVVLRNSAGTALWSTGTAGKAVAYFDVYGNGQVVTQDAAGRVLAAFGKADTAIPGVVIGGASTPATFTEPGPFRRLQVQPDGNVVVYDVTNPRHVVWTTGTAGAGQVRLIAQTDGNLVLRQVSTGRAVWSSGSHGPTAYYQFDLQDDGNIVLYRTDGVRRVQAVWSTGIRR